MNQHSPNQDRPEASQNAAKVERVSGVKPQHPAEEQRQLQQFSFSVKYMFFVGAHRRAPFLSVCFIKLVANCCNQEQQQFVENTQQIEAESY